MLNKFVIVSLKLFKSVITNPTKMFQDIGRGGHDFPVYFLFIVSVFITFFKSFSVAKKNVNFFSVEFINKILSFFAIPQIQWIIVFFSFVLFIFLISIFCRILLKGCNKKGLIVSFLSISSAGILLHIMFFIFHYFLSRNSIYMLRNIAFVWIIYLSIIAIKNSQNTSYIKSVVIYIFSALPVVLLSGLIGIAPFLLWVAIETAPY